MQEHWWTLRLQLSLNFWRQAGHFKSAGIQRSRSITKTRGFIPRVSIGWRAQDKTFDNWYLESLDLFDSQSSHDCITSHFFSFYLLCWPPCQTPPTPLMTRRSVLCSWRAWRRGWWVLENHCKHLSLTHQWFSHQVQQRCHGCLSHCCKKDSMFHTPISQPNKGYICGVSGCWWSGCHRNWRVCSVCSLHTWLLTLSRPSEEELAANSLVMKLVPHFEQVLKEVDVQPGLLHSFIKMVSLLYALQGTSSWR